MNRLYKMLQASLFNKFFFFLFIPFAVLIKVGAVSNQDLVIPLLGNNYIPMGDIKIPLSMDASEFTVLFKGSDIAEQLKWSLSFLEGLRNGSNWVFNLWPPGMPFLYLLVVGISGPLYFPLKMLFLAALFYGLSGYILSASFNKQAPLAIFSIKILYLIPFFYSSFSTIVFSGLGIFSSDFYCLWLLSILFYFLSTSMNVANKVLIAFIFSALIYLRSFYYISFSLLYKIFFLISILYVFSYLMKYGAMGAISRVVRLPSFKTMALILISTWLFIAPWKFFYLFQNKLDFPWTSTDQVWAAQWRDDYPKDTFLVGLNTSCLIQKELCNKLSVFQLSDNWATPTLGSNFYRNLTIITFIENPRSWYREKYRVFNSLWFEGHEVRLKTLTGSDFLSFFLLIFAILFPFALLLGLKKKWINDANIHIYLIYLFFCLQNLVVFTFAHYEPRYSLPLKWATMMMVVYILCVFNQRTQKVSS